MMERHWDDAEPLYQRKLDIAKALFGEASRDYAQELGGYAQYLSMRNEYASAMHAFEAEYKILSAAMPNDMQLMGVTQGLAMMYWTNNDQPRAIQELVGRLGRNDQEVRKLRNIYHNLIRYWAEL